LRNPGIGRNVPPLTRKSMRLVARSICLALVLWLASAERPPAADAALPGQNGTIAFGLLDALLAEETFYAGLYIGTMDPMGRDQRRIGTRLGDDGLDATHPEFSPQGRFVAVSWEPLRSRRRGLALIQPNGRFVRRLTYPAPPRGRLHFESPPSTLDSSPTWSPNGKRVAFDRRWCETEGGDECASRGIYTVARDGTDRRRVVDKGVDPSWSSNGEIVFVDDPFPVLFSDGDGPILVTDPRGARVRTLAPEGGSPDWSPDGERIAFTRSRNGYAGLFVINADGTGLRRLYVSRRFSLGSPAWSPDGRRIAFLRNNALTTISPSGSELRRGRTIACRWCDEEGEAVAHTLDWEPLPRASTSAKAAHRARSRFAHPAAVEADPRPLSRLPQSSGQFVR
jgi:WD40-like Beta Propeller Repeat